jgi:hypothetical protein
MSQAGPLLAAESVLSCQWVVTPIYEFKSKADGKGA